MKGLVVGGTASGVGKTVVTLAILRALQDAGLTVQPAKAGPDYIDPSHHETVVEHSSRTLDTWLEGSAGLRRNYHRGTGDVCVIEGAMGVYDGDRCSTADVAATLALPVVLVVDASAGAESVAATALGFRAYADRHDLEVRVAGVIAARAHGGSHERSIRESLPDALTYCGRIPPDDALSIPDRHLGLHLGAEAPVADDALDAAADGLRTDRLRAIAADPAPDPGPPDRESVDGCPTVAVARDRAFRFVYPAVRERLAAAGKVVTVSPVAGDDLPRADAVYLPGGYPERFAATLAGSGTLDALADCAAEGTPILGECGGLLALARSLRTSDDEVHEMAGVLPADVAMCDRYQALGHVELTAERRAPTAAPGDRLRGHAFHYSRADVDRDATLAFAVDGGEGVLDGRDGLLEHRTLGTYAHVHAESGAVDALLTTAAERSP